MSTQATTFNSSAVYDAINTANKASSTRKEATASGDAQDRFLTLLTAQLKNQDPLNPLDNAQMTSQLAQISTVDGITKLNATLQTLLNNSTESQTLEAAALVGKGVLIAGSGLGLQNGQSYGGVDLSRAADSVDLTIRDANGLAVRTLSLGALPAGTSSYMWDGTADNGAAAASGSYTVSIEARQGGKSVDAKALQLGIVSSVAKNTNGVSLNVGSLGKVTLSDVKQIL